MKNRLKYLNKNDGYVFIILILVVLGLGTLGITLATSTVSNFITHQKIQNLEQSYYGTDGSMTYVQAVLERATAYGRYHAKNVAEEAYQEGIENKAPLTNAELLSIYNNSFKYYITAGRGKDYIEDQLLEMETNPVYLSSTTPVWEDLVYDDNGIQLKILSEHQQKKEKISAVFHLPYNYVQDTEQEVIIDEPEVKTGKMPIGFYNPLFRAALTTNSNFYLNSGAALYADASATTKIALQWTLGKTSNLIYTDARVDIYGTTIPVLERDNTQTLKGNSKEIYVDGYKVTRTAACESSARVSLTDYYNSGYLSQIAANKNDGTNSYFEATDGDLVLRIYTGNANLNDTKAGNAWKALSGKKGLVIVAGTITSNSGYNLDYFTGGLLVLGSGTSTMNSAIKIVHNEEVIYDAIALYKTALGKDTLWNMFKLDTLTQLTSDPASTTVSTISGGTLFSSPLILGNNYVSSSGVTTAETNPYLRIADKNIYLANTAKGLLASSSKINLVTQNNIGFYQNGTLIWNNNNAGLNTVTSIGNLFNKIDYALLKTYINSGISAISREKTTQSSTILKAYTGNITINNTGKIGDEIITGKKGFLFVNGRLTIDGSFNFNGVIIATNGINAYNGGDVKITYDLESALDAINLSSLVAALLNEGANVTTKTDSVYDLVTPIPDATEIISPLFDAAVTISNVKFLAPYTSATVLRSDSEIILKNSTTSITGGGNGIGLQATTPNILLSLFKNGKSSFTSDTITATSSGTYTNANKIGALANYINITELKNWLESSQGGIIKQSGSVILGVYSDGQNIDLSQYDGLKGFLFYNGMLQIDKKNFDFDGVIVATKGLNIKNKDFVMTYDKEAALEALALDNTALKIFDKNLEETGENQTTYYAASNSGSLKYVDKGVTIMSWNTIK